MSAAGGPSQVVVNGKFLSAGPTGVHRVAAELVRHTHALIEADPDLRAKLSLELWVPSNATQPPFEMAMPTRVLRPFTGIAWEHITLPLAARGKVLLSLCNVGPVFTTNAVTMYHDAQVRITPASYSLPFRAWYWFHQSIAGKHHRRILTVSDFSRDQLDRYAIARSDRTGVILNGVDHVNAIVPDDGVFTRLGLDGQDYVVALANTQAHKNIGLLLRAFSDPRLAKIKLVLFGSAKRDNFEKLGFAVPDNVSFAGWVSDPELRALYSRALCLAFPSTTEGFGLPPLEAMTTGCPAIVAPMGALPQVCGDAAVYADANDPAAWADAIVVMATDPAHRLAFSDAGREQAAMFTWDRAARSLIKELLALRDA